MTSLNKPTSKPLRVAKMSVKPIWRKKLNPCNTSNELNVSSPTPMPKPLTPHHEPSQENNHPNQALPNPYIKDTPTSPQVVSHPPFPISPINSHVTHTQAPPQSDNQTQHTPPLSPSRESLVDDINQLQDLSNLLAMHLSQQQNNIPSSPYSPNLPHTLNINQVETHVGFRGEKIDDEYERDCEIKVNQLLQDYNGLDIEMRKKERVLMEEKYLAVSQHTLIDSSPKFDYLLQEFSSELAHIDPIPPRIKEADFDLEEEILSLSPSPIPVEDSDSLMEEVDLFLATDDSMPSGIENDDYDSEGDIRFLKEFLSNDSPPLPENESSNLDHFNNPSSPRPPPKPPDVEICLNFEPDAGILMTKVVKGISEHYVLMPNTLPTLPTLDPDSDFTPSHDSLGYRNKIFDLGMKSNPRDFYHRINFLSYSSVILFLQCLTFCFRFRPKTRTKCSILGAFLTWMFRISISILLDQLKYGGSSQAQDSPKCGGVLLSMVPSGESKVHIEVLSMLRGNRLLSLAGSQPMWQLLKDRRT
ncbi:hypothetical protein Tco_0015031 [Tanacetum coccineum]